MTDVDLTDGQIVELLKSGDPQQERAALDYLYGDEGGGALLLKIRENSAMFSSTTQVDAGRVFNALLTLAQNFGRAFGLDLKWVQEQPDPHGIVIPPSGQHFR